MQGEGELRTASQAANDDRDIGAAGAPARVDPRATAAPPDVRVLKVSQVDAGRLDGELTSLLRETNVVVFFASTGLSRKEQFMRIFSRIHPGAVAHRQPELTFVLDLLVFYFTVWSCRPTPGMELMNLRYRDERRATLLGRGALKTGMEGPNLSVAQRALYGLIFVGGRFAWSKFTRRANVSRWGDESELTWRHKAWRLISFTENVYSASSLVNLMMFLRFGQYRSLPERLLGARLVYTEPNMSRIVSFEYLNRQLVWQELSMRRVSSSSSDNNDRDSRVRVGGGNLSAGEVLLHDSPCTACQSFPVTTPYSAQPCGHVYCYYCVRARCKLDAHFKCPACNQRVLGIMQVS